MNPNADVEYRFPFEHDLDVVGSDGSAWTRRVRWGTLNEFRRIHCTTDRNGYYRIRTKTEGTRKKRFLHCIILDAFVGPRPSGLRCRHLNGNPSDNRVANLAWGTARENAIDMMRQSRCWWAVLTEAQVLKIRDFPADARQVDIAKNMGVSQATISGIRTGKTWSHL